MREYHPLDVRHPSNRDLMRRNFLLDPPRAALATPRPAASGHREAPASRPARTPAAPWGQRREAAAPAQPAPTRRGRSGLQGFWLVGLFLVIFGAQNGWIDPVLDWLRLTAWQLGITLPF